jgi:hypothetical protein
MPWIKGVMWLDSRSSLNIPIVIFCKHSHDIFGAISAENFVTHWLIIKKTSNCFYAKFPSVGPVDSQNVPNVTVLRDPVESTNAWRTHFEGFGFKIRPGNRSYWSIRGFGQSLQANPRKVPEIRPRPLPPASFPTYLFLIILSLDSM